MEFDRKFSIGNVVTIGTIIVGGIMAWTQVAGGTVSNAREIMTVQARVSIIENNYQALLRDLNVERVEQTRILTELQTDLRYVRESLKR